MIGVFIFAAIVHIANGNSGYTAFGTYHFAYGNTHRSAEHSKTDEGEEKVCEEFFQE